MASLALAGALLTACTSGPPPPPAPSVSGPPASSSTAEPSGPPPTASPPNSVTSSSTEPSSRSAPIGSAPPQVVRLGWLGRRPASSGVQIAVAGGTRWQGVVPGEYALLRGQGYQWFGADGSAVGCSAPGVCVGVDAAGYTAVLKGSVDRLVFYPDGRPLGRFDPEGRAVTGGALPAMSEAVAGTGVDMAALLDAASRPVPFAGGITGDPHVLTGAGRRYSTELTGQYHARYGDPDLAVQVRLEPVPHQPNVSVVTAVAVGAKSSVFEFSAQGAASLNRIVLPAPRPFKQVSIKDGPAVGLWATDKAGTAHAAMVWASRLHRLRASAACSASTDPIRQWICRTGRVWRPIRTQAPGTGWYSRVRDCSAPRWIRRPDSRPARLPSQPAQQRSPTGPAAPVG